MVSTETTAAVGLELTPEQSMLVEATHEYLAATCDTAELVERRHDADGFARDYWQQGAELGWTSLAVPEEHGGGTVSGEGVCDLGLVAFEFGRAAAPGPLAVSNVVAAAIARAGSDEQRASLLPGLLDGTRIATWAHAESRPHERLLAVAVKARRSGGGYVLSGRKAPVESARQADFLLVTARADNGELLQLLVPTDTPGVSVVPMQTLDISRRFASVAFDDAVVPASAALGSAGVQTEAQVERQLQIALVVQLFEIVGAMSRAMEYTNDWLFSRYSFGRPLASYQVLKHRFADMRAWLEAGVAIADAAARHVQDETDRAPEFVSVGKSFLGTYGLDVLQECVQFHGGIGVTLEHDLHLFLRRVVLDSQLDGTVADHRERLTTVLERREADGNKRETSHG